MSSRAPEPPAPRGSGPALPGSGPALRGSGPAPALRGGGFTPVGVVGVSAGGVEGLAPAARRLVDGADLVVGPAAWLDDAGVPEARRLELGGRLEGAVRRVEEASRSGTRACVLASGDPGFFGIVRLLAERLGPGRLDVHPAPSAVSLAFARIGLPWDDALVVSAHGRPVGDAVGIALASGAAKVAFLTGPDAPPELLAAALVAAGSRHERAVVASGLGSQTEKVVDTDLPTVAAGSHDARSVLVVLDGQGVAAGPALAWSAGPAGGVVGRARFGREVEEFEHRDSMITGPEVRAVVLSRLELPGSGVLWDIGAGSGSVGIEAAALAPGLRVFAVEQGHDDAGRIRSNAAAHGVGDRVEVVTGSAPAALDGLADPDRVFVGGGGIEVLESVLGRVRTGVGVVATYAALDRAAVAASRLGSLAEVRADRGRWLPDGGLRLEASNPVFVAWGVAR